MCKKSDSEEKYHIFSRVEPGFLIKSMKVGERQLEGRARIDNGGYDLSLYGYMNISQWCSVLFIINICQ